MVFFFSTIISASGNIIARLHKNNHKGYLEDIEKYLSSENGLDIHIERKFPVQGRKNWGGKGIN